MTKATRRHILKAIPAVAVGATVTFPAKAELSVDERIEAAVEEMSAALQAKFPDNKVISKNAPSDGDYIIAFYTGDCCPAEDGRHCRQRAFLT